MGWDVDPVVAQWPGLPALRENLRADVCVVGLGGSGLAAIGEVLRRGMSVVGLDAGRIAAGAAGRNGGFLLAGPAIAVHHAADEWGLDVALAIYRETLDEIRALGELMGPAVIRNTGSIRLAGLPDEPMAGPSRAGGAVGAVKGLVAACPSGEVGQPEQDERTRELADCERQFEVMRAHSLAVEHYDGPLGRGLFLPDDAAMNPACRALAMAELYSKAARMYENSAAISIAQGQVRTEAGSVSAGLVIVAVDGRLEVLLPELNGRVRTVRLQMLATAPVRRGAVPCPVYGRWGYDYAQQDSSGRLFVGGGRDQFLASEWTTEAVPTQSVQAWIERVASRFAGGPVDVTHRWAASVGFTPDARPIVAMVRPGVIACGGYNGTGNVIGPIAARAAVALGLDGRIPPAYFSN